MQTLPIYRDHLITPKTIVVIFDTGIKQLSSANDKFEHVKDLIEQGRFDELAATIDKANAIRAASKGKFTVVNGIIQIDGESLPEALSRKLIALVDSGRDTDRLERFWDNLSQNPTESAREDLYAFIEANDIALTSDGCFVAYKKVLDSWYDSWTGKTYLNKPGSVVTMPRQKVDHDRRNTCSAGLHVAAFEYAGNFSGQRLLEVKVNPRDVVAVPPDYSQQKMRVCQYQVIREVEEQHEDHWYDYDDDSGVLVTEKVIVTAMPDSESRIRVPGILLRKLDLAPGDIAEVVHDFVGDEFLTIQPESGDDHFNFWASYTVQKDNSIRISKEVLEWAELDESSPVTLEFNSDTGCIEVC